MNDLSNPAVVHEHQHESSMRIFGFWVYLMSDCVLFAALFATYAVLVRNTAGGPTAGAIFDLRGVIAETACLLFSSFSYGIASVAAGRGKRAQAIGWLGVTIVLGLGFLGLELREFAGLIADGHGPQQSAFLSAFFTLVGTHGLHVTCGLLWMAVLVVQMAVKGILPTVGSRLASLGLFWHFLDVIWICIFSFVYLLGVM